MSEKKKSDFSPVCFRVSPEERERLEREAGNMTVSVYIRTKLFGEQATPRKRKIRRPTMDEAMSAKILASIMRTQAWNNLNQIARAMNSNTWVVTPETEKMLQKSCNAIIEIRNMHMKAQRLNGNDEP